MISKKFKCIFVHVPKTAGQSIDNFFLDLHDLSWDDRAQLVLKYNPDRLRGPERLAHLLASEYVEYGYISQADFRDYYKFSFVRNPWARLVSEYHYRGYRKKMTFKEFVLDGLPKEDIYTDTYRHIIPQYDYLYDDDANLLVDFVGKFEDLQRDFDKVCNDLGLDSSALPHANASSRVGRGLEGLVNKILARVFGLESKHYTTYYDEELVDVVRNMYVKDIEAFGYKFGG